MKLHPLFGLCSALSLVWLPAAAADVKRECIDASTAGQTSRDAGQWLEARAQFLRCASDACPAVVRSSCSQWLSDVEGLIPSVVIRAADAHDLDITDGTAMVDGVPVPLDGKPVSLDPGPHSIVVKTPSGLHLEKKVLLAAGERSRLIELRATEPFTPAPALPTPAARLAPLEATPADASSASPSSIGPWVLGGTSLVALGSFTVFAIAAKNQLNRLQATCSPSCSADQTAAGKRDAGIADISLGVSVAALAGAVTWALLNGSTAEQAAPAAQLSLAPSRHGGLATLRASF